MKCFLLLIFVVLVASCNSNEKKEAEIKDALKPLVEKQIVAGKLKCELSFVKILDDELSLFCLPVDKADLGMINELKIEITSLVSDWSVSKNYKFKKIKTRFLDELSDPVNK